MPVTTPKIQTKNRPISTPAEQNAQISLAISQNVSHGVVWGSERSEALHLRQQLRRLPDLGEESLRAALDQERQGGQHFMLHASLWSRRFFGRFKTTFLPKLRVWARRRVIEALVEPVRHRAAQVVPAVAALIAARKELR